MLNKITDENYRKILNNGGQLLVFTAPWCGFCNKQKPVLEELAKNNIWIGEVDGDENLELVTKYSVQAFPSFVLLKDGNIISQFKGLRSKDELINIINKRIA